MDIRVFLELEVSGYGMVEWLQLWFLPTVENISCKFQYSALERPMNVSLILNLSRSFDPIQFGVSTSDRVMTSHIVTVQTIFTRVLILSTNLVEFREDWFCCGVSESQKGTNWSTSLATSRKWLTVAIFRKWRDSSVALWIEIAVILK